VIAARITAALLLAGCASQPPVAPQPVAQLTPCEQGIALLGNRTLSDFEKQAVLEMRIAKVAKQGLRAGALVVENEVRCPALQGAMQVRWQRHHIVVGLLGYAAERLALRLRLDGADERLRGQATDEGRAQWVKLANRFFGGLERRLDGLSGRQTPAPSAS
jgi:hypothetical protein